MKAPSTNPQGCGSGGIPSTATLIPTTGNSVEPVAPARPVRKRGRRPLVSMVLDPRAPEVHAGILRAARELRWDVVESTVSHGRAFDGVLSTTGPDELWRWTRELSCPLVRIVGNTVSAASVMPVDGVCTVAPDLGKAGEMAARHLLSLGNANIVFFRNYGAGGPDLLCASFLETCRLEGKEPTVIDSTTHQPVDRANWLLEQISQLPLPSVIMADHDRFAVEIATAARELGLRVPEDIAVIGMENVAAAQQRSPLPVTSVDMNLELLGYTAARLLDRAMRGETIEPRLHLIAPRRVIERESTATFACEIPGISKAILKIRSQYPHSISVPAMARECGMSVRNLYRLYRATTGNTIGKDIIARRMAAAAELLRDDTLKLEPIAIETGLGNAKNLCRLFKEHFGQTPGQWRAACNFPTHG